MASVSWNSGPVEVRYGDIADFFGLSSFATPYEAEDYPQEIYAMPNGSGGFKFATSRDELVGKDNGAYRDIAVFQFKHLAKAKRQSFVKLDRLKKGKAAA